MARTATTRSRGKKGDDHIDGGDGADLLDGGDGTDECLNGETVTNCEGRNVEQRGHVPITSSLEDIEAQIVAGDAAAQKPPLGQPGRPFSRLGDPPRTGSALRDRLRRLSPLLWPAVALLALLLSACQVRQEIRFNVDGSGTASITVGIDKDCQPLGAMGCDPVAQRLLGGEGPVANAEQNAESLPFDVRIEPFESGPPESAPETGYTLSFDFTSLEDLEQKLAPDSATGNSQTSAFEIVGMAFAPNRDGGFTFIAELEGATVTTRHERVIDYYHYDDLQEMSFAIVLPGGEGEHNADASESGDGGTRFQWNFETGTDPPRQLQAATCSKDTCRRWTPIPLVLASAVMAAVVFAFVLRRRGRDERSRQGSGMAAVGFDDDIARPPRREEE